MNADVATVLEWIGFDTDANQATVADEGGLLTLVDFEDLNKEGVTALAESLRKRYPQASRVHVSKGKQDMLVNTGHWAGDFGRVSLEPELPLGDDGNPDQQEFEDLLKLAKQRAEARKYLKDNSKTLSDAAEPDKLKDEKDWWEFSDQLYIYLSAIPGVKGVPLSYIIRDNEQPDYDTEWEDDDFNEQMIACAPLFGPAFITDAQSVHLLMWTLIEAEELLSVIKPSKRQKNGRKDFTTLKKYMLGAGNVSRRIGTAKQLRQSLHYRNERAMKFTTFMSRLRHMHRIYQEENRSMPEDEKVEDLLEKIKAPFLSSQKANLESMHQTGDLTFDRAANILASVVAKSPEARLTSTSRLSQLKTGDGQPPLKLRRTKDGSINVDYSYSAAEYRRLASSDKNALRLAREKAGKTKNGKRKDPNDFKDSSVKLSQVTQIVKDAVESMLPNDGDDKKEEDGSSDRKGDAGAQFGGRNEKRKSKN